MRILIVDDEALARSYLVEQLAGTEDVEITGQATNGFDAVKMAETLPCDLMLLDVQMPKLSGFEVMELLGERAPAVIFVTAHDEFAVQAAKIHAVDYLLKPVEPARLQQALQRAREQLRDPASDPDRAQCPTRGCGPTARPVLERVVIREGTHVHVLGTHNLDFIEAQDDYLLLAAGAKRYRKQHTLAQLEAARSLPLRAHPPLFHDQCGTHRAHRTLRQGQLAGILERRQPPAHVPQRLSAFKGSTGLTRQPGRIQGRHPNPAGVYEVNLSRILSAALLAALMSAPFSSVWAQVAPTENPDQVSMLKDANPHLARNKKFVFDFWRIVYEGRHLDQAPKYMDEGYIQHNPNVTSGRAAFVALFTKVGPPRCPSERMKIHVINIVADGPYVMVSTVRKMRDTKDPNHIYATTWFDMFRLNDKGLIAEHWDPSPMWTRWQVTPGVNSCRDSDGL